MSCNNLGVVLDGYSKGTIKKCLDNAFSKRAYDEVIIASYFMDADFIANLNKEFGTSFNVGDIKGIAEFIENKKVKNQFSGFVRSYYDSHLKTINCSIKQRQTANLKGFVNEASKGKAVAYIATELKEKEKENALLPKEKRKTPDQIITSIKTDIFNETLKIVNNAIKKVTIPNKYVNKINELKQLRSKILELGKSGQLRVNSEEATNKVIEILNDVTKITGLNYNGDKTNIINPITNQTIIDFSTSEKLALSLKRYIESEIINNGENVIKDFGNHVEKNRIALYKNVLYDTNEWFKEVFRISDVISLQKQYEKTLESEKINEFSIYDESDVYDEDRASIDEFSKNWDDAIPKDYSKLFSSKLKLLLGELYVLNNYAENNDNIPYALDEDLGTRTKENVNYLISQIATFANRSSANAFLKSLELMARQNKSLHSLSVLVNKLKKNQALLHYVYSQFDKQVISKIIINISVDDIINCSQSNTASDPVLSNYYILTNSAKFNYKSAYDVHDIEDINKYRKNPNKAEQLDSVIKILQKYFPNIDIDAIINYVNSERQNNLDGSISDGAKFDKDKPFKNILLFTQSFLQAVNNVAINEQNVRNYANEQIKLWEKGDKKTERPRFEYTDVNYSSWNRPIKDLCELLKDFSSTKVQLNSVNAEGNMSSDLIKNSYITRLMQQIKYGNEESSERGLELLKDFVTKNDEYYKYSPIFYGLKDDKGKYIHEGIFERDNLGNIIVNSRAKEMIDISLFDGGKNEASDKRAGYPKMSDKDYFLTQIIAYNNPSTNGLVELKNDKFGGYFLRTPSDAPKNFIIRFFKYNQRNAKPAIQSHLYSELNRFIDNLNNLFEVNNKGEFVLRDDVENLFDRAHYKSLDNEDGSSSNYLIDTRKNIIKNGKKVKNPNYGKFVGNFFQFQKLYEVNGYKLNEDIIQQLSLYGGANENSLVTIKGKTIKLNLNHPLISNVNGKITLLLDNNINELLSQLTDKWLENYLITANERINDYKHLLTERYTNNDAIDAMIGHTIMNMNYDDIFTGSGVYYKNAQDSLKREKEIQAGGETHSGTDFNDAIGGEIIEKDVIRINDVVWRQNPKAEPIRFKNGFKAVTIKNTVRKSEHVVQIEEEIYKANVDELGDKEARRIAHDIAKGYGSNTAMNDAQSYITIEEFISRRYADGTIDEYVDILKQLQEVKEGKRRIQDLDISEVNARIQVQKNFYYDIQFDPITNCYYPRQIKNAEFVLIPELLKGTDLLDLYNTMAKHSIGQVNTAETSKAAKRNILTFWDNNGVAHNEDFIAQLEQSNLAAVENYYYKYLYKQQDVADHMQDTENKAALQITKIIQNNIDVEKYPELATQIKKYLDNYCANIKSSFNRFLYQNGWKQEGDKIVNLDGSEDLIFDEFYEKAKKEVARLGLNRNFIEYLEPDETGHPKMPNFIPLVASKLESIAQAMFNNAITRQKLPGWHGAQVTSIGHGVKAKTEDGSMRSLQYHPQIYKLKDNDKVTIAKDEYNKLSDEEKNKYELKSEAYAEILIPRWSKLIGKEVTIEDLAAEGLDMQIGYRIPTEGKQSISVFKVVGFLDDVYGSTVMVPDEWVVQTGSDFDVDSIYAITYEMFYNKKTDKIEKVRLDTTTEESDYRRRYERYVQDMINEKIKDLSEMRTISTQREELINKFKELSKQFKELKDNKENNVQFSEINKQLNKVFKNFYTIDKKYNTNIIDTINRINKSTKTVNGKEINTPYSERLENIISFLNSIKSLTDFKEKDLKAINEYINLANSIINIINEDQNKFNELINEQKDIKETLEASVKARYEFIEELARRGNLMSYQDFIELPIEEQNTQAARNNEILDAFIEIMSHESTREENYSRSNFEELARVKAHVESLMGLSSKSVSHYDAFDQLVNMKNAMSGRELKGILVNRDGFNSISNRAKAQLRDDLSIPILYDLDEYDIDVLKAAYGNDVEIIEKVIDGGEEKIVSYKIDELVCHSGGAYGADYNWQKIGEEYGILETKAYYTGEKGSQNAPYGNTVVTEKDYKEGKKEAAKAANYNFGYEYANVNDERLIRNWSQAKHADTIFAVGIIARPGMNLFPNKKDDTRIAQNVTVTGGTSYAVTMAILHKKPVYVFDQNENKWFRYDYNKKDFVETTTPILTRNFAGIGTREINDNGIRAIKEVYQKTKEHLESLSKVKAKSKKVTTKKYAKINHKKWGWSHNNRNVRGKLITTYGSQTVAHILDVMKEGAIYNENVFTVGVFKTITDLGSDFEHSVAFLAQPAISQIVRNFEANNSIYVKKTVNEIRQSFSDILGVNIEYITDAQINDIVMSDPHLHKAYLELFGDDYEEAKAKSTKEDFKITDFIYPITLKMLENRLQGKDVIENSIFNPEEKEYRDKIFDLIILNNFNHINRITKNVEKLAKCANADKLGADQTVKSTRDTYEDVLKYSDPSNETGTILHCNGTPFLEAIYPGILNDGDINIKESAYPFQAAFLKYATIPSVKINSQLFTLENERYVQLTRLLEEKLGRKLSLQEYKEFKNYLVASLYKGVQFLNLPITLSNGMPIYNTKLMNEMTANNEDYILQEYLRVQGFDVYGATSFVVKDFNRPTTNELNEYLKLTPAQKVAWLQANLNTSKRETFKGIFKYINVNINNRKSNKGNYQQAILKINDQIDDINVLIQEFENSYYNSNPFVQLAAIDLIKYAFLVEGFTFKRGNISKIISNTPLCESHINKGTNIISELTSALDSFHDVNELIDCYFRSHSDLIKKLFLDKPTKSNQSAITVKVNTAITKYSTKSGLVKIPVSDNAAVVEKILNSKSQNNDYIVINRWVGLATDEMNADGSYKVKYTQKQVLYKVDTYGDLLVLIPLNKLEQNEYGEFSNNPNNNEWATESQYRIELESEDAGYKAKQNKFIPNNGRIAILENNGNLVDRLLKSKKTEDKNKANKLIKDIREALTNEDGEITNIGVFVNPVYELQEEIKTHKKTTQTITIDGVEHTFKIERFAINKKLSDIIKSKDFLTDEQYKRLSPNNKKLYDIYKQYLAKGQYAAINQLLSHSYVVTKVVTEQAVAQLERIAENVTESIEQDEVREASTSLLDDITIDTGVEKNDIDKVAQSIVNEINRRAKSGKEFGSDPLSDKFIKELSRKGLDHNSIESIISNKKNIYASAANYYVQRSKALLSQINEFETTTGLTFSIDSDEFYEYLLDHHEDYRKLVDLILEAKTFGKLINDIFNLNIVGEDTVTQSAIEQIRFAINEVINNKKLLVAQEKIYNNYMANAVSSNPNIVNHIVKMSDVFGDTSFFDKNLSAITELDHKQVQSVIKYVLSQSTKAEMFDAPKAVEDFEKLWNEIEKMDGTLDMSKLIDKNGIRIKKFDQKFIDEYKRIYKELEEAEKNHGKYSKEYIRASLAKDEFRFRNLHQELIPDYYIDKWKNEKQIFEAAPELYIEWKKLNDELYLNIAGDITDEVEIKRKEAIWDKLKNLMSDRNPDGSEKSWEEVGQIDDLKEFIQKKKNIDKKYFNTDSNDIFKDTVKYYAEIVENYEKAHKHESLEQRLKNVEYRQAYNWLKNNGRYVLDPESSNKVTTAFKEVSEKPKSTNQALINQILKRYGVYDAYGMIDARKIPADQLAIIKRIQGERFNDYETGISGNQLIKVIDPNIPPIKSEFWNMFRDPAKESKTGPERLAAIKAINEILIKGLDRDTGKVSTKLLWERTTPEERAELAFQYHELTRLTEERKAKFEAIRKWKKFKGAERPSFEDHADIKVNEEAYNIELTYAQNNLSGYDLDIWHAIFSQRDAAGNFIKDGDSFVPNSDLYGYILPKDDKYLDHKKKEALDIIINAIEFVPNEYYYEAIKEATANGTYNEWFDANHVYNPYKRKFEPLKIWTTMKVKPYGDIKAIYDYDATFDNKTKTPKEEFKNPEYRENGQNYNNTAQTVKDERIGGLHNNSTILTEKEQRMLDLIEKVLNTYTKGYKGKKFIDSGFMPRRLKTKKDAMWAAKQGLSILGLNMGNTTNKEYIEDLNYITDYETDQPMLEQLKAKGFKELIKLPLRSSYSSEEAYKKELNRVKEENEKIKADNLKLESEILDNDWKSVLKDFIAQAVVHNAKQECKNTLYLLLEDLKDNKAYKLHPITGKLIRDSAKSTVEEDAFKTTNQDNTYELVENWTKRFVKSQFKKQSVFTKYASLMQNITSAKYMSFNVVGGIANINTGLVNMFNEYFSKQYFEKSDFIAAQSAYVLNSLGFISSMYSERAPNLTIGLSKLFDIVDYGKIKQDEMSDDIETNARRIRDSFYSFQSGGEHYMQNVVLLAMLKSNKLYRDSDGKLKFGGLTEYQWDTEIRAILNVLRSDTDLLTKYKIFVSNVKNDLNEVKDYDRFAKDLNKEFLKEIGDKKLIQAYIKERNKLLEESKKSFEELPTLESQFELVDGKAQIKKDSELTEEMIAQFKTKVKVTNDKIHGVYDKMGAARIEREWWGGIAMQYHKHIYPGIMKRWRRKGYYNEIRNSVEKGSYISMIQFLGTEFMGIGDKIKKRTEDNENVALASIQTVTTALIDTFVNMKMNWQLMPEWERANCRRVLGDLAGIIAAIAIPMLIYAAGDDDEIEESNFWATCLHLGDRLYSESVMYTPSGLYTEASTLWSSPIASMNTYSDAFKLLSISTSMLFDKDFDPVYSTGLYRGQHKAAVMLYRNIPVYRIYNRISHMSENNNYYRINDNRNNMKLSKNIASLINKD